MPDAPYCVAAAVTSNNPFDGVSEASCRFMIFIPFFRCSQRKMYPPILILIHIM